jgi:hypothetical protein
MRFEGNLDAPFSDSLAISPLADAFVVGASRENSDYTMVLAFVSRLTPSLLELGY